MMKNRINDTLSDITYFELDKVDFFVMDFQNRTSLAAVQRGIEISDTAFLGDPLLLEFETQSLHIQNSDLHTIHVATLPCDVFGVGVKHSECCVFSEHVDSFALFIEIKDCKPKNTSAHFSKAKLQILDTVDELRTRGVIHPKQKVYAVISFPRVTKIRFDDNLFSSPLNTKKDFLNKKIIIAGTNKVQVVNQQIIEHIL